MSPVRCLPVSERPALGSFRSRPREPEKWEKPLLMTLRRHLIDRAVGLVDALDIDPSEQVEALRLEHPDLADDIASCWRSRGVPALAIPIL